MLAVYDCIGTGTGFVGLTTLRVVIQDKSFVGKRVAITSIPYRHVRSVSVVSNTSFAGKFASSSSIAIDVGGTVHEADFRGVEKAHERPRPDPLVHHALRSGRARRVQASTR